MAISLREIWEGDGLLDGGFLRQSGERLFSNDGQILVVLGFIAVRFYALRIEAIANDLDHLSDGGRILNFFVGIRETRRDESSSSGRKTCEKFELHFGL